MEQGADYLGSGAVFGSSTKKDAVTMSFDMLKIYAGVLQFPLWQSEELTFQMFQNLQNRNKRCGGNFRNPYRNGYLRYIRKFCRILKNI